MLSVLRKISIPLRNVRLSAACFSALNSLGSHFQIAYAALFMLMQGPEEPFVTLRTVHGKDVGIKVPTMGHYRSPNP